MTLRNFVSQAGFSLVELSIAMTLISIGMGGVSMMLFLAVQGTSDARYRAAAVTHASSLAELILMNSDAVGHFVNPLPAQQPCQFEQHCSPEEMASGNMNLWREELALDLPGSNGIVCRDSSPDDGEIGSPSCDGAGGLVIKVFWEEPRKSGPGGGGQRRLVSRLPLP